MCDVTTTSTTNVFRLFVAESTPWDTFVLKDSTMPGFKELQERLTWARAEELDETDILFDPRPA